MKFNLRFLLIPLAVILAVALGGGVYWFLESQGIVKYPEFVSKLLPWEDPTKDWNTYTNEELGFSFKYPKEWGEVGASVRNAAAFGKGQFFFGGFSDYQKLAFGGAAQRSYESRGLTYTDFSLYTKEGDTYYFNYWTSEGSKRTKVYITEIVGTQDGAAALIVDVKKTNGTGGGVAIFSTGWAALVNLNQSGEFRGLAFGGYSGDAKNFRILLTTFRLIK